MASLAALFSGESENKLLTPGSFDDMLYSMRVETSQHRRETMTSNDNTPSVGYAGHVGERLSKDYFMTLRELRIVRKACGHMGLSFHQIAARGTLRRSLIECVDAEGTDAGCESWALLNN